MADSMKCTCRTQNDISGMEHEDGCAIVGLRFFVTDSVKMIRETLCVAQSRIGNSLYDQSRKQSHIQLLQRLINECDRHRPLGIGGKHGNLHTQTCGCLDKGPESTWGTVTRIVHGEIMRTGKAWCGAQEVPYFFAKGYQDITCPECIAEFDRVHKLGDTNG